METPRKGRKTQHTQPISQKRRSAGGKRTTFGENNTMAAKVDADKCLGCGACEGTCPVSAIKVDGDKAVVDADTCVSCGACAGACPAEAITVD